MKPPAPIRGRDFWHFDLSLESVQNTCESGSLSIPTSVRRVKRGEVNALFHLSISGGTDLILKVWVRKPDPKDMYFEKEVIRNVRDKTSVPTPNWLHSSPGDVNIPYPHVIMEHAEGEDADVYWDSLTETARRGFIVDCASTMRALHNVPAESIAFDDVPSTGDEWANLDSATFQHAVRMIHDQGWMPEG